MNDDDLMLEDFDDEFCPEDILEFDDNDLDDELRRLGFGPEHESEGYFWE